MNATPEILVGGAWRPAAAVDSFHAFDPTTGRRQAAAWPVSGWADVDAALTAATGAARALAVLPDEGRAAFLERYAARLERKAGELVAAAHAETGLAVKPRLTEAELPRMLDQLRQAAAAAREGTWRMAMIDTPRNIRSAAFGIGPVVVLPPGNFPFAYGAVTGGDFAAAIAAGNPVIAKAHPGCPGVSLLAAREAAAALDESGLPPATVQLLHGVAPADGERLVADPRVGATGFTGGQEAGRKLFAAAAAAGRVIWVEMGSLNPVVLLPGALAERGPAIADELTASVTGSAGQFCTKPGIVFVVDDAAGRAFLEALALKFSAVGEQVLLGPTGVERLAGGIARLREAGARLVAGGTAAAAAGCRHPATLLEVSAAELLARPERLLVEAFGNATLVVRATTLAELAWALALVPGALGASLYLATDGRDDRDAAAVQPLLEALAGRLVENRMPTGLAVTPPMQHGGPWPSAAPPFFSAVGMPWSILRFARRLCFDGVATRRLPECLRDPPPPGRPWRFIDHAWTRG
ncbi:MAG: aldehyde dehydrogenase family protein [Planctomycetia bacterium]|nr:aldehyde dehydrogenase family protein [Planctomycetia bacterium]